MSHYDISSIFNVKDFILALKCCVFYEHKGKMN